MSSALHKSARSLLAKSRSFAPAAAMNSLSSPAWKLSASKQQNKPQKQGRGTFVTPVRSPMPEDLRRRGAFVEERIPDEKQCPIPRVLIVSRRHLRKGKYVDIVGEYHIDLLQDSGAAPILLPRTMRTTEQLEAYLLGGVDGVLVMEGNDLGPNYNPYGDTLELPQEVMSKVSSQFTGDVEIDDAKDTLEMRLIKDKVLKDGVPYLGLCRGSQLLNVAMGGTLYFDVATEVGDKVQHMNYNNYDGHRHAISVLPHTPLAGWFKEEFRRGPNEATELQVNSYHHQGIKKLASGLIPMCFSDDGLVEGFFRPSHFDPAKGKFHVGLQWHPERMMDDYLGCRRVYQDFALAASVHRAQSLRRMPFSRAVRATSAHDYLQ